MTSRHVQIKKKAPIATKTCKSCVKTFKVPSSKKYCDHCEDELVPLNKVKTIQKCNSTVCDKHCRSCGQWYVKVPFHMKRCNCTHILSKINWNIIVPVSNDYNVVIESVD